MRTQPLVALVLLAGCTYVTGNAYQIALCKLDEDGDGDPRCGVSNTESDGDCDDSNPLMSNRREETLEDGAYDGFDNDCNGSDLLDADGDRVAGIRREDYEAQASRPTWPANFDPDLFDCDDTNPSIGPLSSEVAYDGVDQDCDGLQDDEDQDGDGVARGVDCLDTNPDVRPGSTVPDIAYDGEDHDCDGSNDFDPDGDGFLTRGYDDAATVFVTRYGYTGLTWTKDGDCLDLLDRFGDEEVDEAVAEVAQARCPNAKSSCEETWYDGFDDGCDDLDTRSRILHTDFDQDGDGFLALRDGARPLRTAFVEYVQRYREFRNSRGDQPYRTAFTGLYGTTDEDIGAYYDRVGTDCDDVDPEVNVRALERLGDTLDRDCDLGPDTARFVFGDIAWQNTGPVRVTRTRDTSTNETKHWVLLAPSTGGVNVGFGDVSARIVGLSFDALEDRSDQYSVDDPPYALLAASYALHPSVSVVNNGTGYLTATSWNQSRTRLQVASSTPSSGAVNYRIQRQADSGSRTGVYAYLENDLRCDEGTGTCWAVSCDGTTTHIYEFDRSTSLTLRSADFDDTVGAEDCFTLPSHLNGGTFLLGSMQPDGSVLAYEEAFGTLSPSGSNPWSGRKFRAVRSHEDWLVMPEVTAGIRLFRTPSEQSLVLTGATYADADAVQVGTGPTATWAIAGLRTDGQVSLSWGRPTSLSTVLFPVKTEAGTSVTVRSVAVEADSERILLAIEGRAGAEDVVGWVLLGQP
jgi:hypothetical protein